jgi:uncharacterized protein YhfF
VPEDATFELGAPGPLRDSLVSAVLRGEKVATSGLLAHYEADGEPLPVVGERRVLVDSVEQPVGEIVITEVAVIRLGDADHQLALEEGEGFRSVADWRAAHESFWHHYALPELPTDFLLDDNSRVVVVRFRLAKPR